MGNMRICEESSHGLEVSSTTALGDPPAHLLDLSTLSEQGRKSQSSGATV
jgi:hypothetical protein